MMWIGLFSRELGRDFRHSLSVIKSLCGLQGNRGDSERQMSRNTKIMHLMVELSKELGTRCPMEGTVVMLRRDDYHLASRLGDYFGKNCRILADESIRIGGLKVMNQ